VPFQPPRTRVHDLVLDAITPHTPVATVQVSYPVTTLLNRRLRDAWTLAPRQNALSFQ